MTVSKYVRTRLRNNNIICDIKENENNNSFLKVYYNSLQDTIFTLSTIFANILFFSIILSLTANIIRLNEPFNSIIIGIIEFSSGLYNISNLNISLFYKGLFTLLIVNFGSFSIHMQILSINDKIKYIKYLFYRIFNVSISLGIYIIIFKLLI